MDDVPMNCVIYFAKNVGVLFGQKNVKKNTCSYTVGYEDFDSDIRSDPKKPKLAPKCPPEVPKLKLFQNIDLSPHTHEPKLGAAVSRERSR